MYWIKLSLIWLDSQFNRNSLAFQTNILGHGSQMQLRLSDIYSFQWRIFFLSGLQDLAWTTPVKNILPAFNDQILQCKQLYIHLILHITWAAGCHRFILSFFGFLGVLFSNVDTVATHKICQGHLKLRKQRLHPIHF